MNIGEYVRIQTLSGQGKIAKLEKIDDICITDKGAVDRNNIIKHSKKLIDLVQVGDYVNGSKVIDIAQKPKKAIYVEDASQQCGLIPITKDSIKNIVTKEQFEAIQYEIK